MTADDIRDKADDLAQDGFGDLAALVSTLADVAEAAEVVEDSLGSGILVRNADVSKLSDALARLSELKP